MLKSEKQFRAIIKLFLPSASCQNSKKFAVNFWEVLLAVNSCPFCFNGMTILCCGTSQKVIIILHCCHERKFKWVIKEMRKYVLRAVLEQLWNCAWKLSFMWLKLCLSPCAYCFPSHACLWGPRFIWLETQSMNPKDNFIYVNLDLWREPVTLGLCSQIY